MRKPVAMKTRLRKDKREKGPVNKWRFKSVIKRLCVDYVKEIFTVVDVKRYETKAKSEREKRNDATTISKEYKNL